MKDAEVAGLGDLIMAQINESGDILSQVLAEAANDSSLDFDGFVDYLS